jgi:tetratricopeptide (TPR) repeat protein
MKSRNIILFLSIFFIFLSFKCTHKEEHIKNARRFIKEWNYDRALTEIISFRREKDDEIQYLIGYCYLKKNEFGEALTYFEKSLALTSVFKDSIIELYNTLAHNALKIKDPERALYFYQEIAKLVPEYEQANNLFLVGDMNFDKGNYPAAFEAYRRAFEIDSTSEQAKKIKYKYIRVLKECDSLSLALKLATEEYERLKTAANLLQLSEIRFKIGFKLFNKGWIDSALVLFEYITANQEPKSLLDNAYFYIGEIYLKKDKLKNALEAYKKVLRLNPYEKGELVKKAKARIKEIKDSM